MDIWATGTSLDNYGRLMDYMPRVSGTAPHRWLKHIFRPARRRPTEWMELPEEVYRVLRRVVEALRQGLAVTVAPLAQTLTTQEAADLLG